MNSGVRVFALLAALLVTGSMQYVIKNSVILKHRPVDRIVGGNEAVKGIYPYQLYNVISIGLGKALCGGTILSDSWGLTAAHCTVSTTPHGIESTAGEHDLTQDEGTEQKRTSIQIIVHEAYNGRTFENDISIFQVDLPWNLTNGVNKICVPRSGFGTSGQHIITGWGSKYEGGSTSTVLLAANVTWVSDENCRVLYNQSATIFDSNICAGGDGLTDTCQGDSGGPLVKIRVFGVASWGNGCARQGYPGIYTETSFFATWITNHTGIMPC